MNDAIKAGTLPGMMELLPHEQVIFDHIKNVIEECYKSCGAFNIDTPVMERLDILLAKGGGETEKQVYTIENTGTKTGLRFDLTVPLARYVSQHYNELSFPFRRYQIAKVYRGERNQRGRYREFYQCDYDIIADGDLDIHYDAEMVALIYRIFKKLKFPKFTIEINNRNIVKSFIESKGVKDSSSVIRVLDKIKKIGEDKAKEELLKLNINTETIEDIMYFINIDGENKDIIEKLKNFNNDHENLKKGISDIEILFSILKTYNIDEKYYKFDLKLQRGFDYYTGTIFETILDDYNELGSVCGGGRYDNLCKFYTNHKLAGIGMSIGLSRVFFQLNEAGLIDKFENKILKYLIVPMDTDFVHSIKLMNLFQDNDITAQVLYDKMKMKKIFDYAEKNFFTHIIFIGADELNNGYYSIKDLNSKSQEKISISEIENYIRNKRSKTISL